MEIQLLGVVEIRDSTGPVYTGPARQRAVLAALAVDAGRAVPVATLSERIWGNTPPERANHALQVYVSRLRGILRSAGGADLVRRGNGYVLELARDKVDLLRFHRLVQEGGAATCTDERRRAVLQEAMGLWRGEPLADVAGDWAARTRNTWTQLRLDAVADWAAAEQRAGNPAATTGPLAELAAEHPAAERLVALLMYALVAAGRLADALAYYVSTRRYLSEELGADPGAELAAAHRAALRRSTVDTGGPSPRAGLQIPAELPPDVAGFSGRRQELGVLEALSKRSHGDTSAAICVITGMGGSGKTSLAVHWGHRAIGQFPDGQLYVNLRGFSSDEQVMSTGEALRCLLAGLGTPAAEIPPSTSAQVGLFRTKMAGRRILQILDNARDGDQVRDLLPGSPTCMVLVTSRQRLAGLVAASGAASLRLTALPPDEAHELLARRIGADRVEAEPGAVADLLRLSGCLPLALAILAARAAVQPDLVLARLAEEVRGDLDAYADGDQTTDLRAVFSWSYRVLSAGAARVFRLSGLHPGPDADRRAVAALADQPPGVVRSALAELVRANLVVKGPSGRYSMHDLLRSYAGELVASQETAAERDAAIRRCVDHYLHSAHAASRVTDPNRVLWPAPETDGAVVVEPPKDLAQALDWFDIERATLLGVVRWAVEVGLDTHAGPLIRGIGANLERSGHWHDWLETQRTGLEVGRRLNNRQWEATAAYNIGRACGLLGEYDDGLTYLSMAYDAFCASENLYGQANVHLTRSWVLDHQGQLAEALREGRRALDGYVAIGERVGQGLALNCIGYTLTRIGDHEAALEYLHRALALHEEIDDPRGKAQTLDSLGLAYKGLGQYESAMEQFDRVLRMLRENGDRPGQGETLLNLGDTHADIGDVDTARDMWQRALLIFEEFHHRAGVEKAKERLGAHGSDGGRHSRLISP